MIYSTADLLLAVLAITIAVPMFVFFVECALTSIWKRNQAQTDVTSAPRVDVVIPAHNEETEISTTLATVMEQVRSSDRVFVVADNCSDATADVARACGAEVLERSNSQERGKGFALQFAIDHLRQNEPATVIVFLDADCQLGPNALKGIAHAASKHDRPAQAAYVIECDSESSPVDRLSSFAILVKNVVRPLGMRRLGLPCLLTGSGMALPWRTIENFNLASGNIVEDMRLAIELTIEGHGPMFVESASVVSQLPSRKRAKKSQRTRWEHGHLATLATQVPRLLGAGLRQRRIDMPGLALDLCVPPLSLLAMFWLAGFAAALVSYSMGHSVLPLAILVCSGVLMMIGTLAAWYRFGRRQLPLSTLLAAPWYVVSKLPIYLRFILRRETTWIRTERDSAA